MLNVSESGNSISCKCVNCSKEQNLMIQSNKNGTEVVNRLNEIKAMMGSFKRPVDEASWREDVDSTFNVVSVNKPESTISLDTHVELAIDSIDPETGEGDLLTCSSKASFISENGKYKIEEFCIIKAVRSEEQTQTMFCILADNPGIGGFRDNEVGVIVTTLDGKKIEFSSFGRFEINDVPYYGFSPINLRNPEIDIFIEGTMFGASSPQVAIDAKWQKLGNTPVINMEVHGTEGVMNFLPNPDFMEFPVKSLFIEHLNALK